MPPARLDRQASGAEAEQAACLRLQAEGLRLLARNARYRFGEIDLIFQDQATVAFVEVRLRRNTKFGGGAASVDAGKRRKIAQAWLSDHPRFAKAACRFDVVAVTQDADRLRCDWIRAAFTLDDLH
jgi:putative endonuclease